MIKRALDTLSEVKISSDRLSSPVPKVNDQPKRKRKSNASPKKTGIAAIRKKQYQTKVNTGQTTKAVVTKVGLRRKFQCTICKAYFEKSVSLGGHYSKAHPGQSKRYNAKLETRASRKDDRKFLKLAKDWFAEHNEVDPSTRPNTSIRSYITKIKKILKAGGKPNWEDY